MNEQLKVALRRLSKRYGVDLEKFNRQDENEGLPLWMSSADKTAARAMIQAKRDVCAELATELELAEKGLRSSCE